MMCDIRDISGPAETAAIRQFMALYEGKQRKDPKLWLEYFTSDTFLDAAWKPEFTALLLEKVTASEQPMPKEFLTWLYIVYGFESVNEMIPCGETQQLARQIYVPYNAEFDGMGHILRIAARGPIPQPLHGNEFAVAQSFHECRRLRQLAREGVWNDQVLSELNYITGRYISAYIRERCEQRNKLDLERHPAGLRVFIRVLSESTLPEEAYRVLWQRLDLKSAVMGRGKVFYGRLREIVMEHVPGIETEEPENFLKLNQAHDIYRAVIEAHPEREDEEAAAFFARPDLQKALRSRRFIEGQLLTFSNWRREEAGEGLPRRMRDFYRDNPELPRAHEVESGLTRDLLERAASRNKEEAEAPAPEGNETR